VKSQVSPQFTQQIYSHPQWEFAQKICETLFKNGYEAVLAGGCVRDALLGLRAKDLDIATDAIPEVVQTLFEDWNPILIGKSFGVMILPTPFGAIEVATFRKDGDYPDARRPSSIEFAGLEEDAARRDFTVNALFFSPRSMQIFDFVKGLEDIQAGLIRAVGDPKKRFQEDELRLLRAVRFSGQLGYQIEPKTFQALLDKVVEISSRLPGKRAEWVSRERIRDELDKMLLAKLPQVAFKNLNVSGMGEIVFENWSSAIFPVCDHVFLSQSVESRRLALFHRALQRSNAEHIEDQLLKWKYGRAFVDTAVWMMRYEKEMRVESPDPVENLLTREEAVADFRKRIELDRKGKEYKRDECRFFSATERDWMTALEHWTDGRAPIVLPALDSIFGFDTRRPRALQRRGLVLGEVDPAKARSSDLQDFELQGPNLGRELRRLSRVILLKVSRLI
jgi:tRNA nucleotidyltransferase/poly(A) polymerase